MADRPNNHIFLKNILVISTKPTHLYAPLLLLLNKPNSIPLAPLLAKLVYLCMLFILPLVSTATFQISRRIYNIVKWASFDGNQTREVKFSSVDGVGDNEYDGIGFVKVPRICAIQNSFFYGKATFDRVSASIPLVQTHTLPCRILLWWQHASWLMICFL